MPGATTPGSLGWASPMCGSSATATRVVSPSPSASDFGATSPFPLERLLAAGVSPTLAYSLVQTGFAAASPGLTRSHDGRSLPAMSLATQFALMRADAVAASDLTTFAAASGAHRSPAGYSAAPPAPHWTSCASSATAAAFAPCAPFRYLRLRPSVRVRALLREVWRFWSVCTVYARCARWSPRIFLLI